MPFRIRTKLTVAFVGIILFIISVVGVIAYYNQKALFSSLHRVEYAYTEREYFSLAFPFSGSVMLLKQAQLLYIHPNDTCLTN